MGQPKTKWTQDEETALKEGVKRYGAGKWRAIQKDPELQKALSTRSNVDLKVRAKQLHAHARGKYDEINTTGGWLGKTAPPLPHPMGVETATMLRSWKERGGQKKQRGSKTRVIMRRTCDLSVAT